VRQRRGRRNLLPEFEDVARYSRWLEVEDEWQSSNVHPMHMKIE
jgi:hypothetical protein